jgi:uncharacterized protein YxjI
LYHVEDASGERIGELRKLFTSSLLRSTWEIWDGAGALLATAQERSLQIAGLRRSIDLIPIVGEVLGVLPLPYHFDIVAAEDQRTMGTYVRLRRLRDRYALRLDGDPERRLDRRLALALALSLDALQGR